jgi:hypothetical protein
MTNKLLRSATVLTLSGIVLSFTAWAIASSQQQGKPTSDSSQRKTLRELVQERDVETDVSEMETSAEYDDLRALARDAEAIVVGHVVDEESAFDGDNYILTSYRIEVQSILKHTKLNGSLGVGDELVNGRRASSKLKGSERLKPGRDILLFLWWSPAYKAYTLAGGVSGVFLIDAEQRLRPLGSKEGMRKYDGGGLQSVIHEALINQ